MPVAALNDEIKITAMATCCFYTVLVMRFPYECLKQWSRAHGPWTEIEFSIVDLKREVPFAAYWWVTFAGLLPLALGQTIYLYTQPKKPSLYYIRLCAFMASSSKMFGIYANIMRVITSDDVSSEAIWGGVALSIVYGLVYMCNPPPGYLFDSLSVQKNFSSRDLLHHGLRRQRTHIGRKTSKWKRVHTRFSHLSQSIRVRDEQAVDRMVTKMVRSQRLSERHDSHHLARHDDSAEVDDKVSCIDASKFHFSKIFGIVAATIDVAGGGEWFVDIMSKVLGWNNPLYQLSGALIMGVVGVLANLELQYGGWTNGWLSLAVNSFPSFCNYGLTVADIYLGVSSMVLSVPSDTLPIPDLLVIAAFFFAFCATAESMWNYHRVTKDVSRVYTVMHSERGLNSLNPVDPVVTTVQSIDCETPTDPKKMQGDVDNGLTPDDGAKVYSAGKVAGRRSSAASVSNVRAVPVDDAPRGDDPPAGDAVLGGLDLDEVKGSAPGLFSQAPAASLPGDVPVSRIGGWLPPLGRRGGVVAVPVPPLDEGGEAFGFN
jgi:hypothetical protein